MSADFTLNFGPFSATEAELTAVSEAGKARLAQSLGVGAVSCKLPKSEAADVERKLSREGFAVNVWTETEPEPERKPVLINAFGEPVYERLGLAGTYIRQPGDRF